MKHFQAFCILIFLFGNTLHAQQSAFQNDIDFLYQAIQKTPSYKDQITGDKKSSYKKLYDRLKNQAIAPTELDTFNALSSLIIPIKDKHLAFYTFGHPGKIVKNSQASIINLDSLENTLQRQPADSIEGIYYAPNHTKIGIYKTINPDSLIGLILSTAFPAWSKGQLWSTLVRKHNGTYRMTYTDLVTHSIVLNTSVKFKHGIILYARKSKQPGFAEYYANGYSYRRITPQISYIHLSSFYASDKNLKKASEFYDKVKDSLNTAHLIVDLRGNQGGGDRCSAQFLKLIKHYAKSGKTHVLINNWVFSNAEQFAVRLKRLKNVTLYGEQTDGMITYGNNTGNILVLPSRKYKFYNTDMKDPGHYLQYEESGIAPDLFLHNRSDWISQLSAIIQKKYLSN